MRRRRKQEARVPDTHQLAHSRWRKIRNAGITDVVEGVSVRPISKSAAKLAAYPRRRYRLRRGHGRQVRG